MSVSDDKEGVRGSELLGVARKAKHPSPAQRHEDLQGSATRLSSTTKLTLCLPHLRPIPLRPYLSLTPVLNLGFTGYRRVIKADLTKARVLSRALEKSKLFTILSEIHIPVENAKTDDDSDPTYYRPGLPVVSFRFTDEIKKKYPHVQQRWVQEQLRAIGWIVPNYALPPNCEKTEILRVVVRESLSGDLERKLVTDIIKVTEALLKGEGPSYPMSVAAKHGHKSKRHGIDKHRDHEEISKETETHNHVC